MIAKAGAGIAIAVSVLFSAGETKRPEPFFTEKNVVHYSVIDYPKKGGGGECKEEITITSIIGKDGSMHSTASLDKFNYVNAPMDASVMEYACDSFCFYIHTINWGVELFSSFFGDQELGGDSLRYPLNMKVGDTLPGGWASRKKKSSFYSMDSRVDFRNRKVEAVDTLSTPFGTVIAFRISMKMERVEKFNYESKGTSVEKTKMAITEWFVPEIGVVKAELIDPGYGITRMILQSYKK